MSVFETAVVLLQFTFSSVVFAVIAVWYVWPRLSVLPREDALVPLLLLHAFRYLGLAFLLEPVIGAKLPDYFAWPVAVGDLLTATLALIGAACLRKRKPAGVPLAWTANICGALDFAYGYAAGISLQIPLGAAYYIPALFNPAMVIAHGMIFVILIKGTKAPS